MDTIEEIKRLKSLLDQGAITTEEYNELKKKIINEPELIPLEETKATNNSQPTINKSGSLFKKIVIISVIALVIVIVALGIKYREPIKEKLASASKQVKEKVASVSQSSNTVKDIDGNVYHTVTIGTQIWMVENLKTTRFNDGSAIPLVRDNNKWDQMHYYHINDPAYCWYTGNETANKNTYGALYNWYTVNTNKLCPIGWHVPSKTEWNTLINYLGGNRVALDKLKEKGTVHWRSPNSASNESGFTALPSGWRSCLSDFVNIGSGSFFGQLPKMVLMLCLLSYFTISQIISFPFLMGYMPTIPTSIMAFLFVVLDII